LREALAQSDIVLLSGGTSKGPGDLNAKVLARVLAPPGIIAHGVAIKPGKPLCLAMSNEKPVVVLPGFPTSAIFTFHEFVAPMLRRLAGALDEPRSGSVPATLSRRFQSVIGRRQYVMTHLIDGAASQAIAYPIDKGSGSVTTWSQADGYFAIPERVEYVPNGETVDVFPIAGARARRCDLVIIGSHCVGLDLLVAWMRKRGFSSKLVTVGSRAGLAAAKNGLCDVAGIHLLDMESGQYNHPFADETVEIVSGYGRMQGLVHRLEDSRFNEAEEDLALAVAHAIRSDDVTMINRNRGSGTRLLIDALLAGARPPGYSIEASSHQAVATAIAQGRADFGVAIDIVAKERGLAFRPLREERFDFVMPRGRRSRPAVAAFCELLSDARTREALTLRGFSP
jgi:putative molybdopterin biosynthesis protein